MNRFILGLRFYSLLAIIVFTAASACAEDLSYEDIIQSNLQKVTKISGTFDLYDAGTNQIRNLRVIEILDEARVEGEYTYVPVRFRDIKTGDIVMVEVRITQTPSGSYDSHWSIKEVQSIETLTEKKDNYSDKEIQDEMKAYIEKQRKFTGQLMLFDPTNESMRKLDFVSLDGEVRHYGILSISTARFKDVDSGETLDVDINLKNNEGLLEVDTLKIKKVAK